MLSKILDQRIEGVEAWEWKMHWFLSFQSCHTIKPDMGFQILFRSGILNTSEPQSLIVLMILVLSLLVCLMIRVA
jgi:hypothetical protein